jgi:hypothetical protein
MESHKVVPHSRACEELERLIALLDTDEKRSRATQLLFAWYLLDGTGQRCGTLDELTLLADRIFASAGNRLHDPKHQLVAAAQHASILAIEAGEAETEVSMRELCFELARRFTADLKRIQRALLWADAE